MCRGSHGCSCSEFLRISSQGLLLHRDYGYIPSGIKRMYVVILQFDLQHLTQVQDGFVCVADPEILVDYFTQLASP